MTYRTSSAAGPADPSLTPLELEIAKLAAAGLTNKQIGERLYLSDRTVAARLHHVFPRLGVTSRAELRDALGRLESPPRERGRRASSDDGCMPRSSEAAIGSGLARELASDQEA
jgi:DNA-binding CsgD family transcriptional regulator